MLNCKQLFIDEPKINADKILDELKKYFSNVENKNRTLNNDNRRNNGHTNVCF